GKNIAETQVLQELAQELEKSEPELYSAAQFEQDWESEKGLELFREDLQKVKYFNIGRFPTLTISKPGKAGVIITGYRPYEVLLQALKQVEPNIKPTQKATDPEAYKNYWGSLTERELQEAEAQQKEMQV
ncbi:MAG: DsbA family protein, partial [Hymenobacteraceae bacterium]|nr:DsbA family protein [Hymenobacteraceae bacterium]MDX5396919.1 DsbA family protein [Hymenobacteraceae bacterium]MDX5512993.1 DsbA family protein [Hymenobacteraceae bacterium]